MNNTILPKVELHLHLDCSLSFEVVQQIDSSISFQDYRNYFIAPPKCNDLADYINIALRGSHLMQTKEALRLVTLDLFQQLQADHVIYAEIRFAPLLHLEKNLKAHEVVEAVNEAVTEGIKATGIEVGVILCTLRHYSEKQSLETVRLVEQYRGTPVVGFDIAADEAGYPISNHIKAFQYARQKSIACTAHAGEAKGAASVWETLNKLKVSRIGHGVRSIEDPQLIQHLKDKGIHLEICPTSNVRIDVVESMATHPINDIYNSGTSLSINTDARSIFDLSLEKEYENLTRVFNWQKEHFLRCNLEAIKHAFTTAEKKARLRDKIIEAYRNE